MATVQMPRLSDSMETGKILRWLKKEGEEVVKGEPLVEIESDKANIEVEAYAAGKLSKILVKEGDSAPIGAVIAEIGAEASQAEVPGKVEAPRPQATNPEGHVRQAERAAAVPAMVTPAAHEEGGGEQYPQGGTDDRTEVGAAAQAALNLIRRPSGPANGERQKVSPVARRIAEENGVELSSVRGTGPGGRITKEDVEAAASKKQARQPVAASAAIAVARPTAEVEVVELSKMQTTVAMRLAQSKFSAPHFYVTSEIAMDDAVRLRQMFNEAVDKSESISVNDLVVKAVALALTRFPQVNASWADGRIERKRDINIGIAVGLADGLIVPVVHNADRKSLKEIALEARQLIDRAKAKRAGAQDYQGNTFTVSNLGMYDVDQFTAIINPPDSAILAVGSVQDRPVVKDGQIVAGKRMRVTLSVDHRVFYGVTAAQFLQEVKRLLQSPMALVL
ncbi:MAG: pyruvate dehydrogenase complex dihydrolipoamide acetyltransferase [Candidatus Dormibacteria bacterium]